MALTLTMAYSANPRIAPIADGTVQPEHFNLNVVTVEGGLLFFRNLKYDEFDASEMSISETMLAMERREVTKKWDWSAIPVFPSRGQFWAGMYANTKSGINSFADLKGKRIGVPDYDMTATLWMRILLKDLYGIEASDNIWYNGRTKEFSHGGPLGLHLEGQEPVGIEHHWTTSDQYLDVMLDRGELDAAIMTSTSALHPGETVAMDRYGGTPLVGNPNIKPVSDDNGKGVISEFFKKTGAYHSNHHVIVQNRILRDHPWVAMDLFRTFQRSKEVAYERARKNLEGYFYFPSKSYADEASVFGEDPYPFGLKAMGTTVSRAIKGSLEQGLIRKPLEFKDIYHYTTLDT